MASDGDLESLERDRQDADRKYNEALTAFDAALVRTMATPDEVMAVEAPPLALPGGWRGKLLEIVQQWLRPWMDRQSAFNARTAEAVGALVARERERALRFEGFQSRLILLLQQVTAFVETKDRLLAESHQRQLDEIKQQLRDNLPDLHSQVAVLQRIAQMLTRDLGDSGRHHAPIHPPAAATTNPVPRAGRVATDDYRYVGFEDQFRGSVEEIAARLAEYVPVFAGASDVLDVGCGRGEFLALLKAAGVFEHGVDLNAEIVATARERGLDAVHADALAHLESLPDSSLGGFF